MIALVVCLAVSCLCCLCHKWTLLAPLKMPGTVEIKAEMLLVLQAVVGSLRKIEASGCTRCQTLSRLGHVMITQEAGHV